MIYETAIFDMDGTILDTLEDIRDSTNVSLAAFDMPERTLDEIRSFVGNGAKELIERAVPDGTSAEKSAAVLSHFKSYYGAHAAIKTGPYPGLTDALETLRDRGVCCAVVSNKPDAAVKLLAEQYFPGAFAAAVGARDGVAIKPAPDTVYEVIRELRADPAKTVYIGDSDVDIETAKNAGIDCISVTWGFRDEDFLRENGATVFAHDAGQLLTLLA